MHCKRLSVNVEKSVTKKFDTNCWLKICKSISWLFSFFEVNNSLSSDKFRRSLFQTKSERRRRIILGEKPDNFNARLKSCSRQPVLQGNCCVSVLWRSVWWWRISIANLFYCWGYL